LPHADRRAAEQRIGENLAQVGDEPRLLVLDEAREIDLENVADAQQHGQSQRALIVLELVQVAGRDLEQLGQGGLGDRLLLAQPPELVAEEELLGHGRLPRDSQSSQSWRVWREEIRNSAIYLRLTYCTVAKFANIYSACQRKDETARRSD